MTNLSLVDSFSDIVTHILICKADPLCSSICILSGFLLMSLLWRDAKNTPTVCNDLSIFKFGSRMETVIAVFVLKILKSMDRDTFFVFTGIHHLARTTQTAALSSNFRSIWIKFAVYTGFHYFNDIILHTRKNNLCLRITKSCIIFQNLRAIAVSISPKKMIPLNGRPSAAMASTVF